MRKIRHFALLLLWLLVKPSLASAQSMNLSLARLRVEASDSVGSTCAATVGTPPTMRSFCPNGNAWRSLMQELGGALLPPVLTGASTGGPDALYVGVEGTVTGVRGGQDYWQLGTRGDDQSAAEGRNRDTAQALYLQRVTVRKGLPFGFEVGSSLGFLVGTSYATIGAELKFSLFEGFHRDWGAFVPDVAVRGAVQTLLGDSEASLVTPSFDILASKTFTLASSGTLTPILGTQLAWIIARSEVIDLTPDVDAYARQRDTGSVDDFNNNGIFPSINAFRARGILGVQGRYKALLLGGSMMFDLSKPDDVGSSTPLMLQRQWSASFALGLAL